MEDSYFETPADTQIIKGTTCFAILLLFRIKRSWAWSMFVSANPKLRRLIKWVFRAHQKDQVTVERRINKLANFCSSCLLFTAVANNYKIPKDYLLVFILMSYYGELNSPSCDVVVSPTTMRFSKVHAHNEHGLVQRLYRNKHKVIFPALFAQILSNYLTPTTYRLNHRYLSGGIKEYILNPIWRNLSVSATSQSVNWVGLAKSFTTHSSLLFFCCVFVSARSTISTLLGSSGDQVYLSFDRPNVLKNISGVAKKALAYASFMYSPHLISMFIISLTLPLLNAQPLRLFYLKNKKQFIKYYIKLIGFVAAYTSMLLFATSDQSDTILSYKTSFDAINKYLFRVVALSKWRTAKSNHPWFTLLRYGTWDRLESALMCYGVWKLMNLSDYVAANRLGKYAGECERLEKSPLVRVIDKILH